MNIIIDFNRTIYDPDAGTLLPGAFNLLQTLANKGCTLYLVSRLEPGRGSTLAQLGIEHFFTEINFVPDKEEAITRITNLAPKTTYVIGDHLHNEIRIGNHCGAKTIWFKQGRFAHLVPEEPDDHPWRTVEDLTHIPSIIFS